MKQIIEDLKDEFKEIFNDMSNICRDEGILLGGTFIILFTITVILSIPFLPIYLVNELSKSWFKKNDEE